MNTKFIEFCISNSTASDFQVESARNELVAITESGTAKQYCEWHLDDDEAGAWESACGTMWCFEDGDPQDNGMKFCPFCGRHLKQREPKVCPDCGGSGYIVDAEGNEQECLLCQ